jgi:nitronate monooxygenase
MRPALFKTRITELFGIRHPILCGGLMWLADAPYVAAAVKAGGMGFITAVTFPDAGRFREELALCRELTGGMPFGVNLSISRSREMLDRFQEHVDILCREGVRFVETSGASPEMLLPQLKEAGVKVMHKVPAVRYALSAAKLDVDAIAVVGAEAGGHPGVYMIGTMVQAALAPQHIAKPIVVGGGIGTGRQIAAALAMGAEGVILGSRMLAAKELSAHPRYKDRIVAGDGTESAVVMKIFRNHHRVLSNDSTREVEALEAAGVEDFARYAPHVRGELARDAYRSGDLSRGMIDYGQAVAFANEVQSVEAIFDDLIDDAKTAISRLANVQAGQEQVSVLNF